MSDKKQESSESTGTKIGIQCLTFALFNNIDLDYARKEMNLYLYRNYRNSDMPLKKIPEMLDYIKTGWSQCYWYWAKSQVPKLISNNY